jgi:hypothetical protein
MLGRVTNAFGEDVLGKLVQLDEDELFGILGKATNPRDFGPHDAQVYVRLGRAWFQQKSRQLQNNICSNDGVRLLVEAGAEYNLLLEAATVAQAVADLVDQKAIFVFSVLVAKLGLTAYCGSQE